MFLTFILTNINRLSIKTFCFVQIVMFAQV